MRRLLQGVVLAAVILVAGCLVTSCAQSARGAVTASSPSAGAPATPTPQPSVTPTAASPTAELSSASPTAAPTTASTAPSPTPSSSSTSTRGFNLAWLWVALGALVLLAIILLATRSPGRGRPSAAAANWRSRAVDAYAKGAALDSAVRAAERQGVFTEAASIRWADLQRRADDLTETLYAMRETAPTENRRVQVENAILSLRAVRDAIDAQRSPGDAAHSRAGSSIPGYRLLSRLSTHSGFQTTLLRKPPQPLRTVGDPDQGRAGRRPGRRFMHRQRWAESPGSAADGRWDMGCWAVPKPRPEASTLPDRGSSAMRSGLARSPGTRWCPRPVVGYRGRHGPRDPVHDPRLMPGKFALKGTPLGTRRCTWPGAAQNRAPTRRPGAL